MNITIVGAGYVGLSLAILLSRKHKVKLLDLSEEKVELINNKLSPIKDSVVEEYLSNKKLRLTATTDKTLAYKNSNYIIVSTPTNYDLKTGSFDTKSVETVISEALGSNTKAYIIIKSTIPLGFTDKMRKFHNTDKIFFSPEFLRESNALYDNLYPSRVIIGDNSKSAIRFGEILIECSNLNSSKVNLIKMSSKEAEAVKLFSNTFLAMRISYFNELDSFAEVNNLSSEKIIKGVSSDPRIGDYYNNPSFGYGGYCLPKDTKQLLKNYNKIPNNIIRAVVESNETRKEFIANAILNKNPKIVGIYRLVMKEGSDNFRESAILGVISRLKQYDIEIILHEPSINKKYFKNIKIINDLNQFILKSDLIIANRFSDELKDARDKVYSRDLFGEN